MQIQAFNISGIELLIPRHIGDVPVLQDDETLNEGGTVRSLHLLKQTPKAAGRCAVRCCDRYPVTWVAKSRFDFALIARVHGAALPDARQSLESVIDHLQPVSNRTYCQKER